MNINLQKAIIIFAKDHNYSLVKKRQKPIHILQSHKTVATHIWREPKGIRNCPTLWSEFQYKMMAGAG